MADQTSLNMLMNSTSEQWNRWRADSYYKVIDLSGQRLSYLKEGDPIKNVADFRGFHFIGVNLDDCRFDHADLTDAMFCGLPERTATYRNVIFSRCNLQASNLLFTTWENCKFLACDLSGVGLHEAAFPYTDLTSSNLTNAKLIFTNFESANLTDVRFDGCDLGGVNLRNANLSCASLPDAQLIHDIWFTEETREFVENEFGGSQNEFLKWNQFIYENTPAEERNDRITIRYQHARSILGTHGTHELGSINSHDEYFNTVRRGTMNPDPLLMNQPVKFYFRGEPGLYDGLRPSLFRSRLSEFEADMLYDLNSSNPGSFQGAASTFEELVVARHHGLPTRILDITRDPMVALYYACQDPANTEDSPRDRDGRVHLFEVRQTMIKAYDEVSISAVASFAKLKNFEQRVLLTICPTRKPWDMESLVLPHDSHMLPDYPSVMRRLLQINSKDNAYFADWIDPKDLFSIFVVEPRQSFPRLAAQKGAFLISAYHEDFDADYLARKRPPVPLYRHAKIHVPEDKKASILEELDILGVNEETLFPGLDSSARGVVKRFEKLRDTKNNRE